MEKEEKLEINEFLTITELSEKLNITFPETISKFMENGIMVSINHRLDKDMINLISKSFGYDVNIIKSELSDEDKEIINYKNRSALNGDMVNYKGD